MLSRGGVTEDPEDTEQCGCWFWLYKILLTESRGCSELLLHFRGSPTDAQRVQAGMSGCPGMGGPPTSGLVVLTAAAQGAGQVCQCLGTRQPTCRAHVHPWAVSPALCLGRQRRGQIPWTFDTGSQSHPPLQRNRFRLPASAIMPGSDCICVRISHPFTCLGCNHLILTLNH